MVLFSVSLEFESSLPNSLSLESRQDIPVTQENQKENQIFLKKNKKNMHL